MTATMTLRIGIDELQEFRMILLPGKVYQVPDVYFLEGEIVRPWYPMIYTGFATQPEPKIGLRWKGLKKKRSERFPWPSIEPPTIRSLHIPLHTLEKSPFTMESWVEWNPELCSFVRLRPPGRIQAMNRRFPRFVQRSYNQAPTPGLVTEGMEYV